MSWGLPSPKLLLSWLKVTKIMQFTIAQDHQNPAAPVSSHYFQPSVPYCPYQDKWAKPRNCLTKYAFPRHSRLLFFTYSCTIFSCLSLFRIWAIFLNMGEEGQNLREGGGIASRRRVSFVHLIYPGSEQCSLAWLFWRNGSIHVTW